MQLTECGPEEEGAFKCPLCGVYYRPKKYGHNGWPLTDDINDKVCADCNYKKVVPARLKLAEENNN